jgi:hypothetical protein
MKNPEIDPDEILVITLPEEKLDFDPDEILVITIPESKIDEEPECDPDEILVITIPDEPAHGVRPVSGAVYGVSGNVIAASFGGKQPGRIGRTLAHMARMFRTASRTEAGHNRGR